MIGSIAQYKINQSYENNKIYITIRSGSLLVFRVFRLLEPKPRSKLYRDGARGLHRNTYLYINGFYKPIYEYSYGFEIRWCEPA